MEATLQTFPHKSSWQLSKKQTISTKLDNCKVGLKAHEKSISLYCRFGQAYNLPMAIESTQQLSTVEISNSALSFNTSFSLRIYG